MERHSYLPMQCSDDSFLQWVVGILAVQAEYILRVTCESDLKGAVTAEHGMRAVRIFQAGGQQSAPALERRVLRQFLQRGGALLVPERHYFPHRGSCFGAFWAVLGEGRARNSSLL